MRLEPGNEAGLGMKLLEDAWHHWASLSEQGL